MEDYRIQPKDVIVASIKKLRENLKWAIGAILLLSMFIIIFYSTYIQMLKNQIAILNTEIVELKTHQQNATLNTQSITILQTQQTISSKCATDNQQRLYLQSLLGNISTTLIYNGSAHGWMAKDFHSRCDNKGPTISLFKIKDGDCVGGYTSAQWSTDKGWVQDKSAILFNLSRQRRFNLEQEAGTAIGCYYWMGPMFTGSGAPTELSAYEPFNGEGKCFSRANKTGYRIGLQDGLNMLTNRNTEEFTITELEVWEVKFNNSK